MTTHELQSLTVETVPELPWPDGKGREVAVWLCACGDGGRTGQAFSTDKVKPKARQLHKQHANRRARGIQPKR